MSAHRVVTVDLDAHPDAMVVNVPNIPRLFGGADTATAAGENKAEAAKVEEKKALKKPKYLADAPESDAEKRAEMHKGLKELIKIPDFAKPEDLSLHTSCCCCQTTYDQERLSLCVNDWRVVCCTSKGSSYCCLFDEERQSCLNNVGTTACCDKLSGDFVPFDRAERVTCLFCCEVGVQFEVNWPETFVCCKGISKCMCCDMRVALPPDEDVPFAIACCGKYFKGGPEEEEGKEEKKSEEKKSEEKKSEEKKSEENGNEKQGEDKVEDREATEAVAKEGTTADSVAQEKKKDEVTAEQKLVEADQQKVEEKPDETAPVIKGGDATQEEKPESKPEA